VVFLEGGRVIRGWDEVDRVWLSKCEVGPKGDNGMRVNSNERKVAYERDKVLNENSDVDHKYTMLLSGTFTLYRVKVP
jgi:hypothetical protein